MAILVIHMCVYEGDMRLLTRSHLHTSTLFRHVLRPSGTFLWSVLTHVLSPFLYWGFVLVVNIFLSHSNLSTSCVPLLFWYFRVFFIPIPSNFSLSHHCYYFCSPVASWFPSSPISAFKAVLHISGATKSEHISSLPCLANGARTVCTSLSSLNPYLRIEKHPWSRSVHLNKSRDCENPH